MTECAPDAQKKTIRAKKTTASGQGQTMEERLFFTSPAQWRREKGVINENNRVFC
jgi:hypothetical protein